MENKHERAASDVLEGVVKDSGADYLTFLEIKTALHERGFGLVMLFFALPIIILPPGLTAIPAIPLVLFALQMVRGADSPWLPNWIGEKTIKRSTVAHVVVRASPRLKMVEKWLRPRFYFASSSGGEKIIGIFTMAFALSIMIPLPLTNFMPAIGISMMSLGLISKDGLAIVLGMVVGSVGITMTTMILFLGTEAATKVIFSMF